jgi:hypothetical protein
MYIFIVSIRGSRSKGIRTVCRAAPAFAGLNCFLWFRIFGCVAGAARVVAGFQLAIFWWN